ncbi:MAG: hypothetical protein WHT06_03675 [Desulfobacterales bacterium]
MEIRVEPGDEALLSGPLSPRAVWLGERRLAVVEVLDRWAGAEADYVKIRAEDGGLYILRRELRTGLWELAAYQGPEISATGAGGNDV